MLHLMCCYNVETRVSIILRHLIKHREIFTRSVCHKEHMVLWTTLELLKLKANNGWSDSSFLALLELLSKVLPKLNGLPTSTYLAKNIICPLTLGVEKKSMLARTIGSYIEKNTNSKISVQGAMLVGTNGTTTLRKLPTIIRGKDRRGRTPFL
jgi:hypothetical protein